VLLDPHPQKFFVSFEKKIFIVYSEAHAFSFSLSLSLPLAFKPMDGRFARARSDGVSARAFPGKKASRFKLYYI
jgi:hypothetical protein